ncbi:MAG: hypothetical protein EA383_03640, partial [Spirochaetaceae bacterium]
MRRLPAFVCLVGVLVLNLGAQERDALGMFRQGRYVDAIEITSDELREDPSNRDAMTVQGWSLVALGRYREAAQVADSGLAFAPR